MGFFKGLKDRLKAVDKMTQSINNGDVSVDNLKNSKVGDSDNSGKKGFLKGFKDRMAAVDKLTNDINNSKSSDK